MLPTVSSPMRSLMKNIQFEEPKTTEEKIKDIKKRFNLHHGKGKQNKKKRR